MVYTKIFQRFKYLFINTCTYLYRVDIISSQASRVNTLSLIHKSNWTKFDKIVFGRWSVNPIIQY